MQCALNGDASPRHILEMAMVANAAARGETTNIGTVTFAAGVTEKTVTDGRFGQGRLAVLVPLDANAAAAKWWLKKMSDGEAKFVADNSTYSRKFGYVVVGIAKP